ncbi:MAG: hypothetical protein ACTSP3_11710 [Candidatus Heimdallarchaeaceae archaeon]
MNLDSLEVMGSEYLIPDDVIACLHSKYPILEIDTRLVYIQLGLGYPISIHILKFHDLLQDFSEIPAIYLDETKFDDNLYPLLKNLSVSEDLTSTLGVVIFPRNNVSIQHIRSIATDAEIKWLPFSIDELRMEEFFIKTIKSTLSYPVSDFWSLEQLEHVPTNLKFLIKRASQLYQNKFWESFLVILRKILENSIHIWWKRNYNNNDSDLRDENGNPLPLLSRLELVKQKSGMTARDLSTIKTFKLIADFSAHSMEYRASREEATSALAQSKTIVCKLFS